MLTREQIEHDYHVYVSMPTQKRNKMGEASAYRLLRSLYDFLDWTKKDELPIGAELTSLLREWAATKTDIAQSTRSLLLNGVIAMFVEFGYLDTLSSAVLRRRYAPKGQGAWSNKALTDEQIVIVLNEIAKYGLSDFRKLRNYVITASLLLTGSRISQFLEVKDWYICETHISFGLKRAKSREQDLVWKDVPLCIVLPDGRNYGEVISEYVERREYEAPQSEYFIVSSTGRPVLYNTYLTLFHKRNFPFKVTPHTLRHTAATIIAERVGVLQANKVLDHSSIGMTQKYLKKNPGSTIPIMMKAWVDYEVTDEVSTDVIVEPKFKHTMSREAEKALKAFRTESNDVAKIRQLKPAR